MPLTPTADFAPPFSDDAEKSVLGALLQNPDTLRVAAELNKADFHRPQHAEIYDAIREVEADGQPVDVVTVDEALVRRGTLEGVGGAAYLVSLTQHVPTTANTRAYVDIVRECGNRRAALALLDAARTRIVGGFDELGEVTLDVINGLRGMQTARYPWTNMVDVIDETVRVIHQRMAGEDKRIQTGLAKVDALFYGFVAQELTVIGARPSVGKSALAQWIARHAALCGFRVGFISLEMSAVQYGMRTLSTLSGVELSRIRDGNMREDSPEYERFVESVAPATTLGIQYAFSTRYVEDVCVMAMQMRDKHGLDLVIVDYLQILSTRGRFASSNDRVGHISRALKGLAMDLDIPVIAVAQLSRAARERNDKRPVMTDLRDSGAIEQDADNIVMMHRFERDNETGLEPDDVPLMQALENQGGSLVRLRVLKQRQGETFETNIGFFRSRMRFSDV